MSDDKKKKRMSLQDTPVRPGPYRDLKDYTDTNPETRDSLNEWFRSLPADPNAKPKPIGQQLQINASAGSTGDRSNTPIMRASTPKERISDFFGGLMESISEQPLVKGLSKANELLNPPPPEGFKIGMMPSNPSAALGKALAPNVKMMHPSVPPEFHAVEKPVMPQSRTAPIDMNNLPSGKMEFLDPDVADFMNPAALDMTTREGQNRLKVLQYLTNKR